MPIQNILQAIAALLPESASGTDNEGQLIIYTNLYEAPGGAWAPKQDPIYADEAIFVSEAMTRPGGEFFMNDEAVVGYVCVRSTDPVKRLLFLPQHLFKKCFRFVDDVVYTDFWKPVREIV